MGENSFGISPDIVNQIVIEIKKILEQNIQLAIVIGGGNIFRGISLGDQGMTRATGDYMGMLATVMNSLALEDAFNKNKIITRVQSAVNVEQIVEPYIRAKALQYLSENKVVIFSGGTGNPFFTTDTTAALRAAEIDAEVVFKATKVDGVYDSDPQLNPNARRYISLNYNHVLTHDLRVMDSTAISLCKENNIPIIVFNLSISGNIVRAIKGETVGTVVGGFCDVK